MTTTAILFDVVILLILAGFALHGASRGLLLSLCGLVARPGGLHRRQLSC